MSNWKKTTPYGDYKNTKDRIAATINKQTMILREVKKLGVAGKHAGSKPLSRLIRGLAKAHEAIGPSEKSKEQ